MCNINCILNRLIIFVNLCNIMSLNILYSHLYSLFFLDSLLFKNSAYLYYLQRINMLKALKKIIKLNHEITFTGLGICVAFLVGIKSERELNLKSQQREDAIHYQVNSHTRKLY